MKRRQFVAALAGLVALHRAAAAAPADPVKIDKIVLKPDEWKKRLSPVQYAVLPRKARNAPAPPAGSREAQGHLRVRRLRPASLHLRDKYDSGTGWPSFFTFIPDRLATRTDFKLILPRTEYHCARCGGHQGHVFDDGPPPTGKRYCNNGVALKFIPS